MKQNIYGWFAGWRIMPIRISLAVLLCLFFVPALKAQARLAPPNDPNAIARPGQSEIIINATNSDRDIVVWVNGITAAHVPKNSSEKIIVQNGHNVIEAADTSLSRNQWNIGHKQQVTVDSNSNRTTIEVKMRYGSLTGINVQSMVALENSQGQLYSGNGPIEYAVRQAVDEIIPFIPDGSRLAIVDISGSPSLSDFIINTLEHLIFSIRKFDVVDRQSLDDIKEEQKFQYSGEVDDNSAVSLGHMVGATTVITGTVSDSSRYLRVRAINVETGKLESSALVSY